MMETLGIMATTDKLVQPYEEAHIDGRVGRKDEKVENPKQLDAFFYDMESQLQWIKWIELMMLVCKEAPQTILLQGWRKSLKREQYKWFWKLFISRSGAC